ncbi:MAG TPA: VOC family protein [Candidatus Binatia bacterium]|jgi:catechol 2,3-dioxygenase-like lactoylglutathione lyase family enzyme
MAAVEGLKGLRHVALKVRDIRRAKDFYQQCFGMEVVWEPDPQNVYLSSGCDNLALHESHRGTDISTGGDSLDHLGFVVESVARVRELEEDFRAKGVKIVQPFKIHRDGSASFYCAAPDGIVIQMLYEPHLSRQVLK